jgi:hypothetical protein
VWALFGGNPLSANASCSAADKSAPSVTISDIIIMGAHSGLSFVITPTTAAVPPQTGNSTESAKNGTVSDSKSGVFADQTFTLPSVRSYDAQKQKLHISDLNMEMTCPVGFELSWT